VGGKVDVDGEMVVRYGARVLIPPDRHLARLEAGTNDTFYINSSSTKNVIYVGKISRVMYISCSE
jgi:hypothetical protein